MDFEAVKSVKLSDKVAQRIIGMVENGELKPGDKLPTETVLAEKLGVSRGILREALTVLQYQGYISRKPKDGTYIRELKDNTLLNGSILDAFKKATYKDLLEMREALEQKVVQLAIENASDEEIQELENFLDKLVVNNDSSSLVDYDFHLRMAQLSKNVILVNFIDIYYDLIRELGESSSKNKKRKLEVIEEHRGIILKIKSRDLVGAKKAILEHLSMVKKSIDTITINKTIDMD